MEVDVCPLYDEEEGQDLLSSLIHACILTILNLTYGVFFFAKNILLFVSIYYF